MAMNMVPEPLITVERDGWGTSRFTLNRPEKRNALNVALLQELGVHLSNLSKDSTQRVLIIKGAGPVFCAGMDLAEAGNPKLADEVAQLIHDTLMTLYRLPQVTIAAVHGIAVGGGAGLMAACDLAIASDETKIGFPETRRGLIPALIAAILQRELCSRDLRELLLVGSLVDSRRALEMGLVNRVAAYADLLPAANHLASEILKGAPESVRATKRLLEELSPSSLDRDLDTAMAFSVDSRGSAEAEEGIRAFLEKREPHW
ncbi:MAG: enoyl-CoA hydratase/isomerase family protein [Parachlamydia sp.]|nr:enoyl-CoA hydratase/isomerase family protein [Parachlamydia sp.]